MYFSGNLSDESTDPGDQNPLENHQNKEETAKKDDKMWKIGVGWDRDLENPS